MLKRCLACIHIICAYVLYTVYTNTSLEAGDNTIPDHHQQFWFSRSKQFWRRATEQKAKLLSFRYAIPLYYTICNVWTNDACASRSHHWFLNFSQQIKMHSVLFTSCVHLALAVPSNTLNVSNDLFEINGKKCQQWTHSWWKWRERKGANALTNEPNTTQHNTESQCLLLEWWDK